MSRRSILLLPLLVAAFILAVVGDAHAVDAVTTFTVNSTGDASDASPGDGLCATASAECTFRAAIEEANALSGPDQISFAIGSGTPVIQPAAPLPEIMSVLDISGGRGPAIRVEIDGQLISPPAAGLVVGANGDAVIDTFVVSGFPNDGVVVSAGATASVTTNIISGNGGSGLVIAGDDVSAGENLIVANQGDGIEVSGDRAYLFANSVGVSQSTPMPNLGDGLSITGDDLEMQFINTNKFSGNAGWGIRVHGSASGASLTADIGHGATPVGNGLGGVAILDNASVRYLAGWIANNNGPGVWIDSTGSPGLGGTGARYFSNAGLGIDLAPIGVTPNDNGDLDAGPDGLQNFPLVSARTGGSVTVVDLTLNTTPFTQYSMTLYRAPLNYEPCDASGNGEGPLRVGSVTGTTDGNGNAAGQFVLTESLSNPPPGVGSVFTAFANTANGISEFSPCATVATCQAPDQDCDGFVDVPLTTHSGPANSNTGADNCVGIYNPDQANFDGNHYQNSYVFAPYFPAVPDDKTVPNSDALGDLCDADADNDGLSNNAEVSCFAPGIPELRPDFDWDRFTDYIECAVASTDGTNWISKPGLNPASTALCGSLGDADGDRMSNRVETCSLNTNPNAVDSDGDGISDGCEVVSLNGDQVVNSGDQLVLAKYIGLGMTSPSNNDLNRDLNFNSGDQLMIALFIMPQGQCP